MRKTLTVAAAGVIAMAGAYGIWWIDSYRWAGGFRAVTPHFSGRCQAVKGLAGPEDLLIDAGSGIAYVSSYDRSAARRGGPAAGAIFAYDLNDPAAVPIRVSPGGSTDFRPHGLSLYPGAGSERRIFVVNHPPDGDTVEVFEVRGTDQLVHVRTVGGEALVSANDLVAVGPDRFYLTNSRRHAAGLGAWVESTFRMRWGNVVYYDGSTFSEALAGIGFPNGIDVARQGEYLYVVSSFDQAVHVYQREARTGRLTLRDSVHVGTRLDNLNVAADGALWVAGRARYLGDPQPSQVVRITLGDAATRRIEEMYVNLGDEIGNASAAAAHDGHLLIGSSRGNHFLHCRMG